MSGVVMDRVETVGVRADELVIAGRRFRSRLNGGTGRYKDGAEPRVLYGRGGYPRGAAGARGGPVGLGKD